MIAPEISDPVPSIDERVAQLAKAQCTTREIVGEIARTFGLSLRAATAEVDERRELIVIHAHSARAEVRERLYLAANGRRGLPRESFAALQLFGLQHLGYTATGVDARIRKLVERLETGTVKSKVDEVLELQYPDPDNVGEQ